MKKAVKFEIKYWKPQEEENRSSLNRQLACYVAIVFGTPFRLVAVIFVDTLSNLSPLNGNNVKVHLLAGICLQVLGT